MGNTLEKEYRMAEVHGRESILVPGKFIIKERLEYSEEPVLVNYMTENNVWIAGEFRKRFASL